MRTQHWLVPVAAGLLVTAACGSTVPPGVAGVPNSQSLGGAPAGELSSGGVAGAPTTAPLSATDVGPRSSVPSASLAPVGPQASASAVPLPRVAGNATPVRIGFMLLDDTTAAFKAVGGISGIRSYSQADNKAIWKVAINYIDAHGGIAGHPIQPFYYFTNVANGSFASRSQAACSQFTEDEKVFAVVLDTDTDPSMAACLAQHHTPGIDIAGGGFNYDATDLRTFAPYLYVPARVSMSRFRMYIDNLDSRGFFGAGTKIGLLRMDLPDQTRTRNQVIVPALQAHGKKLDSEFVFSQPGDVSDLSVTAEQAGSAVLRFKAAGINRVIFLGSALIIDLLFPQAAQSQDYHPLYGITTDDGPAYMAANAPSGQMHGAIGVGWQPQADIGERDSNALMAANPLWSACAAAMKKAARVPYEARRCTALFFLQKALTRQSQLTPATLRQGVDRLGTALYSTESFGTDLTPGRFDGPHQVRSLVYDDSCRCFHYSAPAYSIP